MKITKTQIILASAGAVIGGAAIFFGLTKTGKGLIKKWFGKEETTEPAEDALTDTTKTDITPMEDRGIVPSRKTETTKPIPDKPQPPQSKNIYAKKALTPVYDLNVLTDKALTAPIRLAGDGELLGTYVKTSKSFWGNKYIVVQVMKGVTRAVASENVSLKS